MAAPPSKIMIIRHGEKPPKDPPPYGVDEQGKSPKSHSLIVPGWQRAGALNAFFAPYKGKPPKKDIAKPDYIYAANPSGETQRPWETVTPLAAWLGYTSKPQFNTDYDVGDESDLVKSFLALSGKVLVCWEHDHIMPDMVGDINSAYTISNYNQIPPSWPDVFYLVWVFDLNQDGKTYTWNQVHQDLMAGDVKS